MHDSMENQFFYFAEPWQIVLVINLLLAFPDEPLVPLALVVGPLIEMPVLAVIFQFLLWMGGKRMLR
jgi:hypothetical protein